MKAVRAHIKEDSILLYIERWLVAPFETEGGVLVFTRTRHPARRSGQSHPDELVHALRPRRVDATHSPNCPFARYADDAVVHCRSRKHAEYVMRSIASRLG